MRAKPTAWPRPINSTPMALNALVCPAVGCAASRMATAVYSVCPPGARQTRQARVTSALRERLASLVVTLSG